MKTNEKDRPLEEIKIVDSGKLTLKKPFVVPKSSALLDDELDFSQVAEDLIEYEEGEYEMLEEEPDLEEELDFWEEEPDLEEEVDFLEEEPDLL